MKPETKPTPTLNHFQQPFANTLPQPNQQHSNIPPLQDASALQQLVQLPISQAAAVPEMKPPIGVVNNTPAAVNKNIIPHPAAQQPIVSKTELPQISPTGNNNKSNINNLNHFNAQQQQHLMSSSNAQSLLSNMTNPNTQGVNIMPPTQPGSAMLASSTNLNQMKQHQSQFGGMNLPFMDSVEHSLASLEQPTMMNKEINQLIMNSLTMGANGFGDMNAFNGTNLNANSIMTQILGMPQMDAQNQNHFMNAQMKQNRQFTDAPWPQNNPMIKANTSSSQPNVQMNHQQPHPPMQMQPPPPQQQQTHQPPPPLPPQRSPKSSNKEKIMLTPKPIEELMNPIDKSKSMSSASFSGSYANKAEQNLKNASSWSQLGHGSPQSMSLAAPPAQKAKVPSDTFQEFKTKAKEQQAQRQKQEQEKMKKQKEQEIKRQQESMIQKQKTNDDQINGHK